MIFFTSDTHFHHTNVLKYSNRPFGNVEEMNEEMIRRWNVIVGPKDEVYHLGDFGFSNKKMCQSVLARLNGIKYLVRGNHDHKDIRKLTEWAWVKDYHELKISTPEEIQIIVLCHYPIESWNGRHHGSWHLHGHCHGSLESPVWHKRLDVGVDCHSYAPLSFQKIKQHMAGKTFKPVGHHHERESHPAKGEG